MKPLLVVLGLALACGHGTAPAPIAVTAANTQAFDTYQVDWYFRPGAFTAFEVQWQIAGGDWQDYPLPIPTPPALVTISGSTPDGVQLFFRVRGVSGAARSDWSDSAGVQRPLRPATDVAVQGSPDAGLVVFWTRGSPTATGIRVERRAIGLDNQPASDWQARPGVRVTDVSYSETDLTPWLDGHALQYRVVYTKDAFASSTAMAVSAFTRPLAPTGVQARLDGGAVVVTWTNASRVADHVSIKRTARGSNQPQLPLVAVPTATWRDQGLPSDLYTYSLVAVVGLADNVTNYVSDPAVVSVLVPPPNLALSASVKTLPSGEVAVRTAGDFAVACQLSVSPPGGPVFQAIAGTLAAGGLELGAGGRTHVVYAESPGAGFGDVPLRHAWLDGAWKIESFAPAVPNARSIDVQLSAAIDGAGALHALYSAVGTGPQTPPPQYATNSSGSWVGETVSPTEGKVILWYSSPIAVRPDGTPAFIGASSTAMQLVVRGADGWHAQDIPGVALGNRSVAFLTPAPDSVLVLYDLYDAPQKLDSLKLIERTAAGWQAPVVLATWPQTAGLHDITAAASADGARLAVAANGSASFLRLRDGAAWREAIPLTPSNFGFQVGFTPQGKAWVLDGLGTYGECFAGQFANYVLYEEP